MKSHMFLKAAALAALITGSSTAWTQTGCNRGPGSCGGGHTIVGPNGERTLLDLAGEKGLAKQFANARWYKVNFRNFMNRIAEASPVFAESLESYIEFNTWYVRPIPVRRVSQELAGSGFSDLDQVAYIVPEGAEIYIDQNKFQGLQDDNQRALLIFHEAVLLNQLVNALSQTKDGNEINRLVVKAHADARWFTRAVTKISGQNRDELDRMMEVGLNWSRERRVAVSSPEKLRLIASKLQPYQRQSDEFLTRATLEAFTPIYNDVCLPLYTDVNRYLQVIQNLVTKKEDWNARLGEFLITNAFSEHYLREFINFYVNGKYVHPPQLLEAERIVKGKIQDAHLKIYQRMTDWSENYPQTFLPQMILASGFQINRSINFRNTSHVAHFGQADKRHGHAAVKWLNYFNQNSNMPMSQFSGEVLEEWLEDVSKLGPGLFIIRAPMDSQNRSKELRDFIVGPDVCNKMGVLLGIERSRYATKTVSLNFSYSIRNYIEWYRVVTDIGSYRFMNNRFIPDFYWLNLL
jgi:hypothetical protein